MRRVIAIDQSYTRCGIASAEDGILQCVESATLVFPDKVMKRRYLSSVVKAWVASFEPEVIVVERVRLFSQSFISAATIIALGGLIATIMDAAYPVPVHSVDTRNWKSKVLGTAKASKDDAVEYIKGLGFEVDHDAADAACMALSAWRGASLKLEK